MADAPAVTRYDSFMEVVLARKTTTGALGAPVQVMQSCLCVLQT